LGISSPYYLIILCGNSNKRNKNKIYLDTVKNFTEVFGAGMSFLQLMELKRFNTGFFISVGDSEIQI